MRNNVTAALLLALFVGGRPARAVDHLASGGTVGARIAGMDAERDRDLATLHAFLDSEEAATAAARFGTDVSQIHVGLAHLGTPELRDLALRAARLQKDPVAGLSHDVNELLVIFLVVAIVLVVLKAA